jgi:hypothetical protein
VAPGTVLVIDQRGQRGKQGRPLSMRVVHATPHSGGGWTIGCRFNETISEHELRCLLEPDELREPTRVTRIIASAAPGNISR